LCRRTNADTHSNTFDDTHADEYTDRYAYGLRIADR
jgi:hypothetical protein